MACLSSSNSDAAECSKGPANAFLTPEKTSTQERKYKLSNELRAASKYKGVSFHKQTGKWQARGEKYIGLFDTEDEAAEAIVQHNAKREPDGPVAPTSVAALLNGAKVDKPVHVAPSAQPEQTTQQEQPNMPKRGIRRKFAKRSAKKAEGKSAIARLFGGPGGATQGAAAKQTTPLPQSKAKTLTFAKSGFAAKAAKATKAKRGGQETADNPCAPVDAATQARMDKLQKASAAEEALLPRWLQTYQSWLVVREMTDSTIQSYVSTFRALCLQDQRSPAAMASAEYYYLAKLRKNKGSSHTRAATVSLWTEFYCDHVGRGRELEPLGKKARCDDGAPTAPPAKGSAPAPATAEQLEGIKIVDEPFSWLPEGWKRGVKSTPSGGRSCFLSPKPDVRIFWDKKHVEAFLGTTLAPSKPVPQQPSLTIDKLFGPKAAATGTDAKQPPPSLVADTVLAEGSQTSAMEVDTETKVDVATKDLEATENGGETSQSHRG